MLGRSGSAAVVTLSGATYTFTNAETDVPSVTNLTFGSFARTGVTQAVTSGAFNSQGWAQTTSISTTQYVGFTVTPAVGYSITLTGISFDQQRSNQGPTSGAVRYSVDNYATAQGTFSPGTSSVNSSWDFTDFTSASAVGFRFYGWNSNNTGGTLRFDNVTLSGSVSTNANLSVPATLNLGNTLRGTPISQSVSITNSGDNAGTFSAAMGGTGFSVSPGTGSVAGGGSATSSMSVNFAATSAGTFTQNLTVSNTAANVNNTGNLTTAVTARVFDSAVVAAGTETGTAAGSASVTGAGSSYRLANVPLTGNARQGGFVNVTGNLSTGPVLVLLDLVDPGQTESLRSTLAGLGLSVSSTAPVLSRYNYTGVNYDLVVTLNPTSSTLTGGSWQYRYDFSALNGFSGLANIGIVPEARSMIGLLGPGSIVLLRRRRV